MNAVVFQPGLFSQSIGASLSQTAQKVLSDSRQAGVFVPGLAAQQLKELDQAEQGPVLEQVLSELSQEDQQALREAMETQAPSCKAPEKSIADDPKGKVYTMSLEGAMENTLLGRGCLYIKEDGKIVDSIPATAGGFGSGAPENGAYTVDGYRNRRKDSGDYNAAMNRDGVGFSFNLNPLFETLRTLLRVHPDGNKPGTLGCVGLESDREDLQEFESNVRHILSAHPHVDMTIDLEGNPNHSEPPKSTKGVRE